MNQVRLDPTQLSILSIPRSLSWIFEAPILRLLHRESARTAQNRGFADDDQDEEFSEDDISYDSGEDFDPSSSWESSRSSSKRGSLSRVKSTGKVDNSCKDDAPHNSGGLSAQSACDNATSNARTDSDEAATDGAEDADGSFFFHIAYTPLECTVMCSSDVYKQYFVQPMELCQKAGLKDVFLIEEPFINLQIDSDGESNNSLRILELTRPLSENGISLFYLSSHFTDIVLIPHKAKDQVIQILSKHNFEFSDISNSYIINQRPLPLPERQPSDSLANDIETAILRLFRENDIAPKISRKAKLLLTGARPGEVSNSFLKVARCIGAGILPDYLAITRTSSNEVSLILPGSAKKRESLGFDFRSIIGSAMDIILPITVDLTRLPIDSTGIVAGLASHIINKSEDSTFEMTYLSMARAGVVMIPEENLQKVTEVIGGFMGGSESSSEDISAKLSSFSF